MIQDRLYVPARDEILYHYCDEPSFRGIMESRTIWASAFHALNDPLERKWGYEVFVESCRRLKAIVDNDYLEVVTDIVNRVYSSSILMVSSVLASSRLLGSVAAIRRLWTRLCDWLLGQRASYARETLSYPV
jgi:hypothetical protein